MQLKTTGAELHNNPLGLFRIKTGNECLKESREFMKQSRLFGDFWNVDELAILFADTGQGKSILSVQIADSISRGEPILGLRLDAQKQKVLYFDFENSDIQFARRYNNYFNDLYKFDDNFLRVTMNVDYDYGEEKFIDSVFKNIEQCVVEYDSKVIIIDNMTYINGDVEKAKDASSFIKTLRCLKQKYNLSILVISHTPKRYETKPIDVNDLSGSKMISNLVDSIFAIGASKQDSAFRYIKQIKSRGSELQYHSENVILCQITNYPHKLEFRFLKFDDEFEHLMSYDRNEHMNKLREMVSQGKSNVEIGKLLGKSEGSIRMWKKKLNI